MGRIELRREEEFEIPMKRKQAFRWFLVAPVVFLLAGGFSFPSRGDTGDELSLPTATIRVRAIHASEHVPEEAATKAAPTHIDASLSDIASKLLKLPYNSFKLVQEQSVAIGLRKKKPVGISGAHQVFIRPLAIDNDDVCLWISWKGEEGDKVLDTRIHVSPGESFVAGTDATHNSGTILAIGVEPVP